MRRLAAAALLLAACSAGCLGAGERVLVVEDADSDERLLAVPVEEGSTVTLRYTHSVERTPVVDVYAVDGTRLENTEMRFQSYGWGLPSRADVTREDGWFRYDPAGEYAELYVKPGRIAGHVLVVDGERFDLVALSGAESVRITVERRGAA